FLLRVSKLPTRALASRVSNRNPAEGRFLTRLEREIPCLACSLWRLRQGRRCRRRPIWRTPRRAWLSVSWGQHASALRSLRLRWTNSTHNSGESCRASCYGGKLNDLSVGETHSVTTLVLALFSASEELGRGEYGLSATLTAMELLLSGAFAPIIL